VPHLLAYAHPLGPPDAALRFFGALTFPGQSF